MALIVQKFGGTSLANVDRIKSVAQRVVTEVEQGNQVVVVVSAMAGVTNQLVGWAHQCAHNHLTASEYDVVVSSGEQATCGLMALALNDLGVKSRSWLSWQIPIHTDSVYKNGTITDVHTMSLQQTLDCGEVAVVAGFQGISPEGRLATLGRGGSDYTAVALAVAMQASRCDIYTDVDGIFTADPRLITNAKKLDHLSYQEVLDIAGYGAKVLQPQSIEAAQGGSVPIRVLSSFNFNEGTTIDEVGHVRDYIAVTSRRDRGMFVLTLNGDAHAISKEIRGALSRAFVEIDYACRLEPVGQSLSVVVSRDDYEEAEAAINQYARSHKTSIESMVTYSRVAQVAVVGRAKANISEEVRVIMDQNEIDLYQLKQDEHALTILLPAEHMEQAVKLLHQNYILKKTVMKDVA